MSRMRVTIAQVNIVLLFLFLVPAYLPTQHKRREYEDGADDDDNNRQDSNGGHYSPHP